MSGIFYLFRTTLKNTIREFFKRPAKIIAGVFFLAMLVLVIISGQMGAADPDTVFRPLSELSAAVLLLYAVLFFIMAFQGFSSGATFYTMADVSLLFSCPISSRRILFYGLVRQMGTSFLVGFFLLFQYAWLHQTYDLSIPGLLLTLLGYALTVFCAQLTAMVLYSATAGREKLQKTAKGIFFLLIVFLAAAVVLPALRSEDGFLAAAVDALNAPWTFALPVFGWLRAVPAVLFGGSLLPLIAGLCLTALYVVLLLFLQGKVNPDFYEDVLKATEISQTAITAKKEGKLNDSLPQNVKLGKTGLGSGKDAFFLKHRLEDRRSGFFLFDRMSLIMAAMTFLFTFFLKDSGMISIFAFATYLQIFTALTGRWVKELTLPYVYLIPQPPFRKLLSICKENLVKILADAVLVMVPVGLILKAGPIVILTAVLARTSFGVLFMSGNILTERIFGSVTNKGLLVGLYILTMMLLAAPGGILGIVVGAILSSSEFALPAGLAVSALWNLLIAALVAFCCRGLLNCAELNNR